MPKPLSIMLAQANPLVGDVAGNCEQILAQRARCKADLLVFSELFLSGYPPEDIVLHKSFQDDVAAAITKIETATRHDGCAVLVGAPYLWQDKLYNSAILLSTGTRQIYHKAKLPNNNVFDEKRLFVSGRKNAPLRLHGRALGVCVCEDIWTPDVCKKLAQQGAEIFIVLNGSPFELTKQQQRLRLARARVRSAQRPLLYVNQVGGQDELVFDGASFALNQHGKLMCQLPAWRAGEALVQLDEDVAPASCATLPQGEAAMYEALQLGLYDYATKNGFRSAVLGLSGGIDSALVAVLAVDALGQDNVHAIMMPSPYTSTASRDDATDLANRLRITLSDISIGPAMEQLQQDLVGIGIPPQGVTAENLQSRLRGLLVMAYSNSTGALLLSTGNKSEMAVGYATLYGDMNGGFNPLKDVYKTQVQALVHWRNRHHPSGAKGPKGLCVPERILTKPPSAELRPNQKDTDSLPDYTVLDSILHGLIEEERSVSDLVQHYPPDEVRRVATLIMQAEYKRRQAPPGVKIHTREFGRGRRYPITSGFRYATQLHRQRP